MRNGQNNNKRMRNRNNNNNHSHSHNNNRRGQNPMTRVYESNGPDIKIRGTASHVAEKYVQLARDARSSGDPVAAENYYQHAEHYFRLIAAAQEQFRQNQPQQRTDGAPVEVSTSDDGDEYADNFSNFGQEPGFVPQPPQQQQQPYMRDHQREQPQPYQRDNQQPREYREHRGDRGGDRDRGERGGDRDRGDREHRQQPQYQPQPPQPQPVVADAGSVDRLPSFITGPQPQINGGEGAAGGGERFPRRRRRPHTPRGDNMAAAPAAEDANPGNE